jgi:transcriptional regulator with XRE-family HTH domain/quercetin dioxygenase-like cupin family protein
MPAPQLPSLGERIRTERKRQGRSLRALARAVGVSPSMMSQIETGKTRPSVTTLYAITLTLGLSFNDVFDMSDVDSPAGSPAGTLVRRGTLHNGGPNTVLDALGLTTAAREVRHDRALDLSSGVTLRRLSEVPPLHVGVFQATFAPGGETCGLDELTRHPGWEYGFLLRGGLVLTLDGTDLRIDAGDAVSFEATAPHRYVNDSPEPAVGLWFVIEQPPG